MPETQLTAEPPTQTDGHGSSGSRLIRGVLITALGGTLWGLNGTLSKYVMETYAVDPLWFACVREFFACWLFLAAAAITDRRHLTQALSSSRALLGIFGMAIGVILLSQVSYLEAIKWTNSGTATVLQALSMPLVLIFVCITGRRLPRRRELVGLVLAATGTYLVATGGNPSNLALPLPGFIWGMLCAVAAMALTIFPARLMQRWGNFVVNGLAFLFSGLVLAVFVRPWACMPALDAFGWTCIGFSVVLGTFGAYGLYLQGVKEIGSVRGSFLSTTEPLVATISSILLLHTSFSVADIVGFIFIIVTVFLTA